MNVKIKLFMGLDITAKINSYDIGKGIILDVKNGTRLRGLKKKLHLNGVGFITAFRDGERISNWTRLKEDDLISFFRPSGGG